MAVRTISCIIPAHNEAERIGKVLEVVTAHPSIAEVIVIDDGSTDATSAVAKRFPSVRLITLDTNRGKSFALYEGIGRATGDFLMFIDADLIGLASEDLTALIGPVESGRAEVSLSLRKNTPFPWRVIGLDYLSGERVFPKRFLSESMQALKKVRGFGFEVFLNRLILRRHLSVAVVRWEGVQSPYKYAKYGLIAGLKADICMMRDIFSVISPFEALTQIVGMLRLKAKHPRHL